MPMKRYKFAGTRATQDDAYRRKTRREPAATVVGYPFDPYYVWYARLRVIAEIPATDEFWKLSTLELKSVAERLTRIGVKAVVAENRPDVSTEANWRDVKVSDSVRFSILLLSEPLQRIR
jgi:hypothetical protein